MTKPIIHTPWGPSHSYKSIASGIVWYSTASHGGYHVSSERRMEMHPLFLAIVPFTQYHGPGKWYEEDCDWCIVEVALPECFKPEVVRHALRALKLYKPAVYEEVRALGILAKYDVPEQVIVASHGAA